MSGKRKTRDSLVIETTKSAPVSKKSRSHSVIETAKSAPTNKVMLSHSASKTTKSAPRTKKRSHSTAANKKCVRFKKGKIYEIEKIYSLSHGRIDEEITNKFTEKQRREIEAEIEKEGIICYDDIYDKFNDAYTSRHFITQEEIASSLSEKQAEKLPFVKWSVNNVADHDNKWCKLAGDICMYGAILLLGSFVTKSLGGKKKSKKTKTRKIRRK